MAPAPDRAASVQRRPAAREDDVIAGLAVLLEGRDHLLSDVAFDTDVLAALAGPRRHDQPQHLAAAALDPHRDGRDPRRAVADGTGHGLAHGAYMVADVPTRQPLSRPPGPPRGRPQSARRSPSRPSRAGSPYLGPARPRRRSS